MEVRRYTFLLLLLALLCSCKTVPEHVADDIDVVVEKVDETSSALTEAKDGVLDASGKAEQVSSSNEDILSYIESIEPGEFGASEKEAITGKVIEQAKRIDELKSAIDALNTPLDTAIGVNASVKDDLIVIGEDVSEIEEALIKESERATMLTSIIVIALIVIAIAGLIGILLRRIL